MSKISDSSGANIDLKENKNATLWRRFTADELTDLVGYTPFFRLLPRDADPIEVTGLVVSGITIEFQFDTTNVPNKCDYVFGWTDPTSKVEVLMYGKVLLV